MNRLIKMWDTYKTIIDDARNCYVQAQERKSSDPIDIAAPFVYLQLQRNPQIAGGKRGALFVGAYIVNKYPHLQDDIIGKTLDESVGDMEKLLLEVFDESEQSK